MELPAALPLFANKIRELRLGSREETMTCVPTAVPSPISSTMALST